jgi:putative transposase
MDQVCAQFGISRQAHYQQLQREQERQVKEGMVLEMVRMVRRKHPRMGVRKLLYKIRPMLTAECLQIGRDQLFDLLRSEEMLVKRKKSYRRTTLPGLWRAPNRLPGLVVDHPDQVWVCDITYLEITAGCFAYLFLLMDLFTRCIVGWQVASSLVTEGALASLEMALSQRKRIPKGLIHHSDHGVQYTSHAYLNTLLQHQILASMGAVGSCYDNIFAERLIGILKNEYALDLPFADLEQVSIAVKEVVHLYNTDRPHLSLNMAVPIEVYLGHCLSAPAINIPLAI